MFFVGNNIPVLATVQDIMLFLQKTLHLEGIPILKDVILPKYGNQDIVFTCPFHKHGNENRPSAGIQTRPSKDSNKILWNCFTCHEKGTLETLISRCFGYDDYGAFGTKWILDNFNSAEIIDRNCFFNPLTIRKEEKKSQVLKYITEEELDGYRYTCSYHYKRHLTDDIIEKYDLGYDKDFFLGEAITFPVKDECGNCLFVARRTIRKKNYWYPMGADKPLYGVFEAKRLFPKAKELYICESMLNALTIVEKLNVPAIAMLGTGTNQQFNKIKSLPYKSFVIASDGDNAGIRSRNKLSKVLRDKGFVSAIAMPEGKDINDYGGYSPEEFRKILDKLRIAC